MEHDQQPMFPEEVAQPQSPCTVTPDMIAYRDPAAFVNRAEPAGNVNASVGAGTTPSDAACIVSECLLDNEDRVVCNKCGYVSFDCNNWIGGLGRVCDYCATEHYAGRP